MESFKHTESTARRAESEFVPISETCGRSRSVVV
jgi:hypothetical protein